MHVQQPARVLGRVDRGRPGPSFVILCAVHGNEPGGVGAARRVIRTIKAHGIPLSGRVLALLGNSGAYARGVRQQQHDLNRAWTASALQTLFNQDPAQDDPEQREQRALLVALSPFIEHPEQPTIFVDLHSTSGPGAPFSVGADTLRNRRLIDALGLPVMLGLEEIIEGTLLGLLSDLGHVTVGVEGGQHDDPRTVDNLESVLWQALAATGQIRRVDIPERRKHVDRLRAATEGLPRYVEVRHRHGITPSEAFAMRPGFTNFQPVTVGDVLGEDANGPVKAPFTGRLLMPLYQSTGDDGFFMGRDVSMPWLVTSEVARRARIDRLLHLLPGVDRHPDEPDQLLVESDREDDPLLRLFGYRRQHPHPMGTQLSRRRPDHLPPIDHRHHHAFKGQR
ncbi:MAG: succinylglutamate desuccinylase/aspartoacylase family protein [Bradymonadia bacterium]